MTAKALPTSPRRWPTLLLLGVGVFIWAAFWVFQDTSADPRLGVTLGPARWTIAGLAAAIAAIPGVAGYLHRLLTPLRQPTARQRRWTALAVFLLATIYLIFTAYFQRRDLFPKTHDDQSYLLQMRMLASGRLWLPQHPLADFFDSFYVLVRPVYASLYFPGASLLYVPTIWLGLPTWLLPACVAGGIVALVYRILAETIDGTAGLLAAVVLLSLEWFRVFSILLTSHEPMLFLGLLLNWAWLRWRATEGSARLRWSAAIGLFAGWGAITRPADAVCFALPVGIAILLDLRRSKPAAEPRRRRVAMLACMVLSAAPFLLLQSIFNKGVTGSVLQTPYALYLEQDQPNTSFGFHPYDPAARPKSSLQQKQVLYDQFFASYIVRHQPETFLSWWGRVYGPMSADSALPTRLALVFLPVGLLALNDRRRIALAAVLPLFVGTYMLNTFFLEHYAILIAPAAILLVLLGIRQAASIWPKRETSVRAALGAGLAILSLTTLPELNNAWGEDYAVSDETLSSPMMTVIEAIRTRPELLSHPDAIVLVPYRFGDNVQEEPVYNTEAAWPDDAPVIFAHDLGERNWEIYAYYAKVKPNCFFYRWNRGTLSAEELGWGRELAKPETRSAKSE